MPEFIGFAPDLDPATEGIIVDCSAMIPSIRGMRAAPSPVNPGLPALPSEALGGATIVKLDNTKRLLVGTATKLFEEVAAAWEDVTRASGPYTTATDGTWRFAQFGNVTIATNNSEVLQQSQTGKFEDIPGAPTAAIVESVAGFVFVFNTTDPVYGTRPDGWWCSGLYDQTIWTPDQATQCANGRIIDTPGDIRAGRGLGPDIVVYKETSMYYGTYQGPPIIWAFNVISNQIGAPCQEAVVSIGTAHYFLGNDNFYVFDGTRPTPIGDAVKNWFFRDQNPSHKQRVRSVHDRNNSLVYWYYVSNASTGPIDSCLVYNYKTGRWGRANRAIECAVDFINGQIVWTTLGQLADTWTDLPQVPWNSPFWTSVATQPSIIDTAHTIQTLTGEAGQSTIMTGDFGDDEQYTLLQYVRLHAAQDPQSASMTTQHRVTLGGNFTPGASSVYQDGKFDVDISSRWHRSLFTFQGNTEVIGYAPKLVPDGEA
ncbi:hypothetical protein K7G19_19860 [Cupriavidus sp. DB3]|uniref:hypothetical protein n=1 Tax=Cupriavidus sp. DB3 TaxID=2873259 RepID=UPI001CF4BE1B|nr:hypothetical protein [Cupriavidus sp. DB3]MCA7085849.1 hypothetical protein [Cupriavidus sp. DB3]